MYMLCISIFRHDSMCLKVLHERQVKAFDWKSRWYLKTIWASGIQNYLVSWPSVAGFRFLHVPCYLDRWYLYVQNPHGFQLFILKRSLKKVVVSVCLSLTAFPSPLHRNSWVDCPWQVAEMLSLLFPEFDSFFMALHVECFKSVYIGYTMVTPWLHHGYTFTFVWLRWLHGWAKAAESGGLLSMLPFGWHLATSSLAFEGPFGPILYLSYLSYLSYLFLVCHEKRCQDEMCTSKLRLGSWPFSASVCSMNAWGTDYVLHLHVIARPVHPVPELVIHRWFWCISYIFIHAPQFSSCFVILVFWRPETYLQCIEKNQKMRFAIFLPHFFFCCLPCIGSYFRNLMRQRFNIRTARQNGALQLGALGAHPDPFHV